MLLALAMPQVTLGGGKLFECHNWGADRRAGTGGNFGQLRVAALILLELDMPRVTDFEVLRKIKAPSELKSIPVVVLTTSTSPEDVAYAYANGTNTFIAKPDSFDELVKTIRALSEFWFRFCLVPGRVQ